MTLAVLGIQAGGDITTTKLSIGCDATSRTAAQPALGSEPGLNGHNKFEGDTSLTRDDFFLGNGDNYDFNGTLFAEMKAVADRVSGGNFDFNALATYRSQRYDESLRDNPNFFFGKTFYFKTRVKHVLNVAGPLSTLLYGAASFLYELFPNFGPEGTANLGIITSFFGAVQNSSAPGGWSHVPEKIPDNWFSRRAPYTLTDVGNQIFTMYGKYPKLFGGNVGKNNFDGLNTTFDFITQGKVPDTATAADFTCLLYQIATGPVPSSFSTTTDITGKVLDWSLGKLNPVFKNAGCPLKVG